MSNNNLSTNIYENNSNHEISKDVKKFIFNSFECINYSKFDEMRKKFDSFNLELINSIKNSIKIDNENVKKGFFTSLENLLVEISLIKDEKLRIIKIDEVFKWFKRKISSFQNIKLDFKSKSEFEKYPLLENYKKSETYDARKNQNAMEKENKIIIKELDNPKERYIYVF